jgi:hypothetical protein
VRTHASTPQLPYHQQHHNQSHHLQFIHYLLVFHRYVTVVAAGVTGWLQPFRLAYMTVGVHNTANDGASALELALLGIFAVDIMVSAFVGYYDPAGLLVMRRADVVLNYMR